MARTVDSALRHRVSLRGVLQLLVVAMVVAFALNLGSAGLLGRDLNNAARSIRQDVYVVQRDVDSLFRGLVDQATSVRGYVLSEDPSFLVSYRRSAATTNQIVTRLRAALAEDPHSTAALGGVVDATNHWRADGIEPEIRVVEHDGTPGAGVTAANVSRALFERVRSEVQALSVSVEARSTAVLDDVQNTQKTTFWLLVGTLVATAALAATCVRALTRWGTRPLSQLMHDVTRIADGELERPVSDVGLSELSRVARAVDAMRLRLLQENEATARRSLLTGQEEERRRLAMGIHDDSVQSVLAASLRLQRLRRHLRDAGTEGATLVQEVQGDLDQAIARLRRLIFELHPPTLDSEGLVAAMRLYLAETLDPEAIQWQVDSGGDVIDDHVTAALAYRLFREAVNNVVRHSKAKHVTVTVDVHDRAVEVAVADDGVGFDPTGRGQSMPGHLGLSSSRQLCEAMGGRWELRSAPGDGTRVGYTVPLDS
jgi:signal transduction histidine kinase